MHVVFRKPDSKDGKGHISGCLLKTVAKCGATPSPAPPKPIEPTIEFECAMRSAAYEYALHLMPSRGTFVDAFDAFELASMCNETRPEAEGRGQWALSANIASNTAHEINVDSKTGSDGTGSGTAAKPFATVEKGVSACRAALPCSVRVHPGEYYLQATLALTAADAGLRIVGVPTADGELPLLSGGVPLAGLKWYISELKQTSLQCFIYSMLLLVQWSV